MATFDIEFFSLYDIISSIIKVQDNLYIFNTSKRKFTMKKSALFTILTAGILWGSMGLFVRVLQNCYLFTPFNIVCLRMVFSALTFIAISPAQKTSAIRLKDIPLLFCTGVCGIMLLSVTYFLSMVYSSLSVAAILLYTAPAFVLIASVLLFKERLTRHKIWALLLTFAGCVCVSGIFGSDTRITFMGIVMGLLSGITYGSYSIFGTFALKKYNTHTVTTWAFIFAALTSLFIGDVPGIISIITSSGKAAEIILLSVGLGIFTGYLPSALYTIGLSKTEPSKAIIIASVEPLVATVLGFVFFKETPTFYSLTGIVLILSSVVLTSKKDKSANPNT